MCNRAERVGGGGEEELTGCSSSVGGNRAFWWCSRWSNRLLHKLCSSIILGPAGTLYGVKTTTITRAKSTASL